MTNVPQPRNLSAMRRLLHLPLAPLLWFWRLRWRYRLLVLALLMLGGAAPAALLWQRERTNRRQVRAAVEQTRFERAAAENDIAAAEAALAQIADLRRGDAAIAARLAALRRGEAEPGDAVLARLLLNDYLQQNRWDEAAREAEKRIAAAPADMLARSVLAHHALRNGRREDALTHLDALPSPDDALETATPGAVLLALRLRRELGRDDADLVDFLVERVLPILKSRQVEYLKPIGKIQIVQCYHEACRHMDRHGPLAELWVPAARLMQQVVDALGQPITTALLYEEHLAVLDRLRQLNKLPEADAAVLRNGLEDQLRGLWERVRRDQPGNPLPDLGLALASYRKGDAADAVRRLVDGLQRGGDTKDLYVALGRLLRQSDPRAGLTFLERAVERFPDDPALQEMLAELARAAGRPDRALEVCRQARRSRPDLPWACRLEAALCLDQGRPTQAVEALAPLRPTLVRDAGATEVYVRALCAIGAEGAANALLAEFPTDAGPEGIVGGARGFLLAGRHQHALQWAERIIRQAPEHQPARQVQAEALRLKAEAGDAVVWETEKVRQAIQAFEWLRRRAPEDRRTAQRLARLHLYGLKAPDLARQSAAPLRLEPELARLSFEMLETAGAVELAAGEPEAARRYLDAAIAAAPTNAGPYIYRCQAYLRLNRSADARSDLERAAALPRSARQAAEYQQAADQLRGVR